VKRFSKLPSSIVKGSSKLKHQAKDTSDNFCFHLIVCKNWKERALLYLESSFSVEYMLSFVRDFKTFFTLQSFVIFVRKSPQM